MEELELDIEGIKNILKVEVTRSVRHSEHIKLDVNNDIEKYKSLVKVAEEKEDFKNTDLVKKVDARIEQHMKKLGYKSSKKSLQFKQLRSQFIELWTLRNQLKEEMLLQSEGTSLDEWFFQKCNDRFGLDLPVTKSFSSPNPSYSPQSVSISPTHSPPDLSEQPQTNIEKISEVLPSFMDFWRKRENKELTVDRYEVMVNHFAEIVGDLPLNQISSKVVRDYKEKYLKIPTRREQTPQLRGKSVQDILMMDTSKFKKRNIRTLNQSLRILSTFAQWCCANSDMKENPFLGSVERNVEKNEDIKGFTDAEIAKVFYPEVFMNSTIHRKGYQPNRLGNYFIPLILCFTGARVSEVCQLHLEDIYLYEGNKKGKDLWVMDFNSNECDCCPKNQQKSIKNKSSHRIIPVHPALIDIGLVRYRNLLEKNGETRLFPRFNYQVKGGWSGVFSHFWNKTYLPKVGLKRLEGRKMDTHSFRHTCLNKMKQNKIDESYASQYAGHHHKSMTFTTYSEPYSPHVLNEKVLPFINYKGLDINKLKTNWKKILENPPKGE